MKTNSRNYITIYITLILTILQLYSFSQKVSNIHFEQVGKQIDIYYDLEGEQDYKVNVLCSKDNGSTWEGPLEYVSGAVGDNQRAGNDKRITWDVLRETDRLSGNIIFKIKAVLILSGNLGSFTDPRDNKVYKWIRINNQIWMGENLNFITDNSRCYENLSQHCDIFGRLYNWYDAIKACPAGWHLPSEEEWNSLLNYKDKKGNLIMNNIKSKTHWKYSEDKDRFSFSALPGGEFRYQIFYALEEDAFFWTSTEHNQGASKSISVSDIFTGIDLSNSNKYNGYSVRCVKN